MQNVYICPATIENLEESIHQPSEEGQYIWAFNSRKKSENDHALCKEGDIFLLGKIKEGFTALGIVLSKMIYEPKDDNWPVRSPSRTHWKHAFVLKVTRITLEFAVVNELMGRRKNAYWRTQARLNNPYRGRVLEYLYQTFPHEALENTIPLPESPSAVL